ncbi:MAG: hypothetical protein AB7T14_09545 [Candidatus Methylacidiphilaceae bacterium]
MAVLSIPAAMAPIPRVEEAEKVRDRLLRCLPLEAIITDEARRGLDEMRNQNAVPPNEPLIPLEGRWIRPYGEEEYLKEQGVPVGGEPNRRIREIGRASQRIRKKASQFQPHARRS